MNGCFLSLASVSFQGGKIVNGGEKKGKERREGDWG